MVYPASIFITGANRGIGLGLVREFLKVSSVKHVIAGTRNPDGGKELNEIKDSRLKVVQVDIGCDNSIKSAYAQVESVVGEGGLNVLLNNAAILTPYFTSRAISREAFMNCINVNLLGTAIVSQTFLPLLLKASSHTADDHIGVDRAAIVNISATWGSIGRNADGSGPMGALAYKVSKAGLNQLGKTMAIDLKGDKILVVQFCPGWVKTDLGGKAATDTVEVATSGLVKAMSSLGKEHSGGFFDRRLKAIPY